MGKRQHSKNKLYITRKQYNEDFGGKQSKYSNLAPKAHSLPFDYCALSLTPFKNPVCTPDGTIYDMSHIVPYVQEHSCSPATGEPLTLKQLVKLNFHKNAKGEFHCPVTYKVFTPHVCIVAVKPSGNVYSEEAVKTLNIDQNNMCDLLTQQKFKKSDVIVLQDPKVVKERVSGNKSLKKEKEASINVITAFNGKRLPTKLLTEKKTPEETIEKKKTSLPVGVAETTTTRRSQVAPHILHKDMYKTISYVGKGQKPPRGYVRLSTSKGNLNLELFCEKAPLTCHNFLLLCERGYYNDTTFHRVIPGFMAQAGDPAGTGKGGESAWGGSFIDEFTVTLRHDKRGVLSMANKGKNTNTSQFFITFGPATHLDEKHTIFGHLVGGNDVLDAIESVPLGSNDSPMIEVRIKDARVLSNPFADYEKAIEDEKRRKQAEKESMLKIRKRELKAAVEQPQILSVGIGKYLKTEMNDILAEKVKKPRKTKESQPKKSKCYGNFSNW